MMRTLIEAYKRNGYVLAERFLPEADLATIEIELKTVASDTSRFDAADIVFEAGSKGLRQLENLQKYGAFWQALTRDKRLLDKVEAIFEASAICENCSYMAKPARVGSAVPFHQDNAYNYFIPDHALTVWLALDASTEENGCVRVIPGSHAKGLLPHAPSGVTGTSQCLADELDPATAGEVPLILQRGDASIHHCCTIHRSLANRSERPRRGVLFFFRSTDCRVDQVAADAYSKNLRRMIAEQGG